ncbi:MAG: hypothetical protein ACLUEF_09035 [Faecalibacterium prausnitzii]
MESRRRRSRSQLLKWGCYVLALFVCAALQTTPGLFQLGGGKAAAGAAAVSGGGGI